MTFVHPSSIPVVPSNGIEDTTARIHHQLQSDDKVLLADTNVKGVYRGAEDSTFVVVDPGLMGVAVYNGQGGDQQAFIGGDEKYRSGSVRSSIDYTALPQSTSGSFSSHGGSFSSLIAGGTIYSPTTNNSADGATSSVLPQTALVSSGLGTQAAIYPTPSPSSTSRPTSQHGVPSPMSSGYAQSGFALQQQQVSQGQRQGQRVVVGGVGNGSSGGSDDIPSSLPPISQDFARPSETRRPATSAGIMGSGGPGGYQSGRFPLPSVNSSGLDANGRGSTPQELMERRRMSTHGSGYTQPGYMNGMGMVKEGSDESRAAIGSQSVRPTDLRLNSAGTGAIGGYAQPIIPNGRRESDYSDLFAHSVDQVAPSAAPYMPGAMGPSLMEQDLRRASASAGGSHQQNYAIRPGSSGSAMSTIGGGRAPGSSHSVRFSSNGNMSYPAPVSPTSAGENGALNSLVTAAGMVGPSSMDLTSVRRASEPHFKHPYNQVNLPSQSRLYQSLGVNGGEGNPQMQRQFAGFQMSPMESTSAGSYGGGYAGDRRGSVISSHGQHAGSSAGGESRRPSFAGSAGHPVSAGAQYASFPPDYRFGQTMPHSGGYPGPSPVGQSFDHGPPMNWPPSASASSSHYPHQQPYAPRADSYSYDPSPYAGQQRGSGSSSVDRRSSMGHHSQYQDPRRESGASMGDDGDSSNGQIDPSSGQVHKKRPRRKFDQIERLYLCGFEGCEKSYGTLNHLNAHVYMQKHGIKRRPEEFKEIRRAWKKQKKDDAARTSVASGATGPAGLPPSSMPSRRPEQDFVAMQHMLHQQPVVHEPVAHWGQPSQQW